jgi:hypothetical protein
MQDKAAFLTIKQDRALDYAHQSPELLELLELLVFIFLGMQEIGRIVMIVGIILAIGGALLWRLPGWFGWIGRLPGDVSVQKGNFSFYFPLATCILISVILTLLSWLFRR